MLDAKIREYILTKPECEEPENLDVISWRLSASVNIYPEVFTCTAIFSTLSASSSFDMEPSESEISGTYKLAALACCLANLTPCFQFP